MRILVVEDEHRIANTLKKGLEQERFAVDVAYDGISGYDLASSEDYDLLILDLMLPGISGMEICKKLRKDGNHVPVLILTAKGEIEDKVLGLDTGADDYLTKPFAFEEMLARVRALMRRPKESLGSEIRVGDLVLNQIEYKVERNGVEVNLSAKEYSLLQYLMRNANKIVTKNQIINHVWDYEAEVLPNTVEVYIKSLRNKIDKPYKDLKPMIITKRGFGYELVG